MAGEARYEILVEADQPMTTRDGVTLRADVYRPDAPGRFPVLVVRTPYDKRSGGTEAQFFPPRGYVVVVQDVRGRWASEGEFYAFHNEGRDGYDAIEWAAGLPWSDGRVGMAGQSYSGLVQYLAAAERPPHLKAASPISGPVTCFENSVYRKGVFELGWMLAYVAGMCRHDLKRKGLYARDRAWLDSLVADPKIPASPLTEAAYRTLPLKALAERFRDGAPYLGDWLEHPTEDDYWAAIDVRRKVGEIDAPMFHIGSWYDCFQYDTLTLYQRMRDDAATAQARAGQRLLMGPWAHLQPFTQPNAGGTGDIDFGEAAKVRLHEIQLPFFEQHLRDGPRVEDPPVRIFVMGENAWRDEPAWPLPGLQERSFYLASGGRANGSGGDGRLCDEVGAPGADAYVYDPEDPAPSCGGNYIGALMGAQDQRRIDARPDILVYLGEVLEADVEVTGPVRVELFAASSARDTDFMAKLVDVRPDGYAQNICDGAVRARFRAGDLAAPQLLTPGVVERYDIDLWSVSHVFKAGHRLRLDITSSNFPRFDRNPNTGGAFGEDAAVETARQTVRHGEDYPSRLVIPVRA